MNSIIKTIKEELKLNGNKDLVISNNRFFKEEVKSYGFTSSEVNKIAKKYFLEIKNLSKTEIFNLCEELWKTGYREELFITCNWIYYLNKKYEESDFDIFENWVKNYINNWAVCDTFCTRVMADFLEKYPKFLYELKKWSKSENRWVKRASAVSLIKFAKKGLFLNGVFEAAETLLLDKDDMVQKGYGWLLKVASAKNLKEVYDFVIKYKKIMPRTAYRYAIEKMPLELKKEAMKK